jgi:uncharacterized membrane protein
MARQHIMMGAEKMAMFGDAVIAIAITLLALDITIPDHLEPGKLGPALRDILPELGAYASSFACIGLLWLALHRLFRLVDHVDGWLARIYLAFLAVIAVLPFPNKLLAMYGDTRLATGVYAATIALAALLTVVMGVHLLRKPQLCRPGITPAHVKDTILQGSITIAVFLTSIPVAFVSTSAAKYWWLLVLVLRILADRRPASAELANPVGPAGTVPEAAGPMEAGMVDAPR